MSRLSVLVLAASLAAPQAFANERLEERVVRLERILQSSALIEMVNQMEQLRQEVQLVRGDLEVVQRELDDLKARQRDLYQDNDRRLRALEKAQQEAAEQPAAQPSIGPLTGDTGAAGPTVAIVPNPVTGARSEGEWEAYQAAFSILRSGRYAEATTAFEAFLAQYPSGRFTDNALYWLGESHYAVRAFDRALPYFQQIVDRMPNSGKYADALLKIGFIHHERRELDQARAVLEKLQQDYPDTTAANLASQRLQRIEQESR